MARQILTDARIRALKPPTGGKTRRFLNDAHVPGLLVCVTSRNHKTFMLRARFPGRADFSRRELGEVGAMSLKAAREKALAWHKLLDQGIDPGVHEQQQREQTLLEAQRRDQNSFAAVVEAFVTDKLASERKGKEVEKDIRRDFLPVWGPRPITEITDLDVITVIKAKRRTAPAQARNLLTTIKRLFSWAVDQRCYGLRVSSIDGLKPARIVGEKTAGSRILSDMELFALRRTAERTAYPYGPVYLLLILTALRLNECADASWSEFDLANRLWVIPAERMKGRNGKARPHTVPLTDDIMAVLQTLPRFRTGEYLFSTTFGKSPTWMSDKIKKRIDEKMLHTLRALARLRGNDPAKVTLPRWTNHDIRRTVRSGLSRLKIAEEAREAVMAHARPGIKGTYDHHDYFDEKREALELWAARVRRLAEPATSNVVALRAGR